ncbi:hypothetical protein [Lysobacter humi (ex Lee et al. 2017)]
MTNDAFDRLQAAWADLDRRVATQEHLRLDDARRGRLASIRRRLWPFATGQLLQALLGIGLIALAVDVETSAAAAPSLMAAAIALHAYGVGILAWVGVTLALLPRFDPGRPVVEVQERLLRLRRAYLRGSIAIGLVWWLMWIPFLAVLAAWLGLDGYMAHLAAHVGERPSLLTWLIAMSVGGFVGSLALVALARKRPRLRERLVRVISAESLTRANDELDAVLAMRDATD